jgi:hypothetical protein
MTLRKKIFIKLKIQEIASALVLVALVLLIWLGSKKVSEWANDQDFNTGYTTGQCVYYFVVNPLISFIEFTGNWSLDGHKLYHGYQEATLNNMFGQLIWTTMQWIMCFILLFMSGVILFGVGKLFQLWIQCNWRKAGILSGEIKEHSRFGIPCDPDDFEESTKPPPKKKARKKK